MKKKIAKYTLNLSVFLSFAVCASLSLAQGVSIEENMKNFPSEVTKWKPWVVANNPELACPSVSSERTCLFTGELVAAVSGKNLNFKQEFHVFSTQQEIKLPTIINEQTQQIRYLKPLNKAAIIQRNGEFFINLKKGNHILSFSDTLSESEKLMLSHDFAIVKLDKNLTYSGATLTLNSTDNGVVEKDLGSTGVATDKEVAEIKTEVAVFRLFEDSVPSMLTTYIDINNYGNAKKINLGKVIPDGFELNEYNTNLAMEYKDGAFSVFAPVGQHRIGFKSTSKNLVNKISINGLVEDVQKETWAFSPVDNVRQFEVVGAQQLDPSKTNMPDNWMGFIAYSVEQGFDLNTIRLGILNNQATDINSTRQTWVGFKDGKIYHSDNARFSNLGSPFLEVNTIDGLTPLSVSANNRNQVLFQKDTNTGVLVNVGNYNISSNWISSNEVPMSFWNADNNKINNWSLHMAPRQNVLWVDTNDTNVVVRGSWLDSWNLYKVFSLFIIGLAFFKIFSRNIAIISVVGIFVMNSYFIVSWTLWLTLLFFVAILKVSHLFKETKFYRFVKVSSVISLLAFSIVSVEFIAREIKLIMNPHLETKMVSSYQYNDELALRGNSPENMQMQEMTSQPQLQAPASAAMDSSAGAVRSLGKSGFASQRAQTQNVVEFDKESQEVSKYVAQVSGSMPYWNGFAGKTYKVDVLSPITKESTIKFIISPVWLTALFSVIQILTLLISLISFSMVVFQINNRQDVVDSALSYINVWRKK